MKPTDRAWSNGNYPHQELTAQVIAAAIKVHKALGPGFVEGIYENAMVHQLRKSGLEVQQQVMMPVFYDRVRVGEHWIDLMVNRAIIVELKAVPDLLPVHYEQVRSMLKAARLEVGLLINFDVRQLNAGGVKRIVSED